MSPPQPHPALVYCLHCSQKILLKCVSSSHFSAQNLPVMFFLSPRLKIRVSTTVKLRRICAAPHLPLVLLWSVSCFPLLPLWLFLQCTSMLPPQGFCTCRSAASARLLLPSLSLYPYTFPCVTFPWSPSGRLYSISSFSTLPIPFLLYFFFLLILNSV